MPTPPNIKPWFRQHDGWWYLTRRVDGRRVQTKLARGRENEEEAYRRYFEIMAAAGHVEPTTEATFNELAARFLSWSRREHDPRTTDWYVRFLDDFDQQYEGRVVDLRKSHVDHWLDRHDWSRSTRRAAITAIKRAVNWGFDEGLLSTYPVGLRKLKRPPVGKRETLVSSDDHRRMIEASDEAFANYLTALNETGARPGEVRSVTASMVDLAAGVWILKDHKTSQSTEQPRLVYLTDAMVDLSRELADRHRSGPLFRNSKGLPWTANAIRCRMRRLREKLDLPEGTVAYAYRHTYATTGLEKGVPIADMAEVLGHSDTKMLSQHYSHLTQAAQRLRDVAERVTEDEVSE